MLREFTLPLVHEVFIEHLLGANVVINIRHIIYSKIGKILVLTKPNFLCKRQIISRYFVQDR